MNSIALINEFFEELIEKAVSLNYSDILKAIDFNAKDWRKIDNEAKKVWNQGGKKRLLSDIVLEILQREYPNEKMENLIWPDFETNHKQRLIDEPEERRRKDLRDEEAARFARFKTGKQEPAGQWQDKPFNPTKFSGLHDGERYDQFVEFGFKLIEEENERNRKKRVKEQRESNEVKRKKSQKEKQLRDKALANLPEREVSESSKLWREYLTSGDKNITFKLIELIGTVDFENKQLSAKRIHKFIDEVLVNIEDSEQAKLKLTEIATKLEEEYKSESASSIESKTGRTNTALVAEADGNEIGKMSKIHKSGQLRIKYGPASTDKLPNNLTKKQTKELTQKSSWVKFDITNERWVNSPILRSIADTWLKQIDKKLSVEKYMNYKEGKQDEIQKKLNSLRNTPKYPVPSALLEIIYDRVWSEVNTSNYHIPDIDFAYWLSGLVSGIEGSEVSHGVDELTELVKLSKNILPRLIKSVDEGIVINPDTQQVVVVGIQRRYVKALRQIDESIRDEVILKMFRVMKGENISDNFKGKNKKVIQAVESSIREQLSEKRHGKSFFHYLLKAHLEYTRSSSSDNILTKLLRERVTQESGEVKFREQVNKPTKEKTWEPKTKDYFSSAAGGLDSNNRHISGKRLMSSNEKRRKKLEAETKLVNGEEVPKYTDKEIDYLIGWTPDGKRFSDDKNRRSKLREIKEGDKRKYSEEDIDNIIGYDELGRRVKKSLDILLEEIGESDDIIFKEDTGLILASLNKKQKKKLKVILNLADPTEYFGHDFLKLEEVIKVLKTLGVVKGDKRLAKKIIKLEDKNLKVVKLATKLRKDYENLYRDLRKLVYPKTGEDKNEE